MSCEGDLTTADLDPAVLSDHTVNRTAGGSASSSNLYPYIYQQQCSGSNLAAAATPPNEGSSITSIVLRPHDTRHSTDIETSITNLEEDSGLLLNIAFSELVRIKKLLINAAMGEERIERCRIWCNRIDPPDLDDIDELTDQGGIKPDQEFQLLEGERDCVEYPVRVARFSSVSTLTIYLSSSRPATQRLFYLGFMGESRSYKKEAGDDITVGAQNTADSVVQGIREKYGASQATIR